MKLLGLLISFGLIASTGTIVNFDTAPLGKMPPGWTAAMTNRGAAPKWEILRDGSAPTQPYVLGQVSSDSAAGNRFPLAILDGVSLRNSDISVRVKPLSGHADQTGGLVFRYRDNNNYYVARASALDQTVAIYKVQDGRRLAVNAAVHHDIPLNAWSILKVSIRGNRFQVYVNHRRILQAFDDTFANSGKVGLWTMGDSVTYFDDFRVYPK
jgi:hypothetical protein